MTVPRKLRLSTHWPQKRAFVTGAASGLGLQLCCQLAADHWRIGMADINASALQEAALQVERAGAAHVWTFELNVADREKYARVAASFLEQAGGIDLLCNNAGVGDGGLLEEYGLDNWEWITSINQMGTIYGCHFFIPAMKKQGGGHIINMASCAAIACAPRMAAYNTTKAAVLALSETLYSELAPFGIGVTVLKVLFFKTNVMQFARGGSEIKQQALAMMEEARITAEQVAAILLRKAGKGHLYVVVPEEGRRMWWLKRLAPSWFLRQVRKMADKKLANLL